MAAEPDYCCSNCKKPTPRDELTVKKAVFLEMGEHAATIRSRVVEWLCPHCLVRDPDWNRKPYDTPFMRQQQIQQQTQQQNMELERVG